MWGHSKELKVTAHSHSGKLIWEKDLGGVTGGHGFAVSPIVFEDLLIVPNDQEKGGGAHYAWIRHGEIRWKVPRGSNAYLFHPLYFHFTQRRTRINFYELVVGVYQPATQNG